MSTTSLIKDLRVSAFTIPTETPEQDGNGALTPDPARPGNGLVFKHPDAAHCRTDL